MTIIRTNILSNYERLSHPTSIRSNQEPPKFGTVMKLGLNPTVNGTRLCVITSYFKGKEFVSTHNLVPFTVWVKPNFITVPHLSGSRLYLMEFRWDDCSYLEIKLVLMIVVWFTLFFLTLFVYLWSDIMVRIKSAFVSSLFLISLYMW